MKTRLWLMLCVLSVGTLQAQVSVNTDENASSDPVISESKSPTRSGNVGIGVINPQKQLDISLSFQLPATTNTTTGIIFKSGFRFIHDFRPSGVHGFNTFLGISSGNFTMTGTSGSSSSYNTGIGGNSLSGITTGERNSGLGYNTLTNNTTGEYNTAAGVYALYYNTEGSYNTAIGVDALQNNISGIANTAVGLDAASLNTTGDYNTVVGVSADAGNQEGSNNTVIGFMAGYLGYGHSKSGNVFLGHKAGYYETGSNKLYIDNSDTTAPLIGGDFGLNEIYISGRLGVGTTNPAQQLHIDGAIEMPVTTNATIGVIYKEGVRFLHDYKTTTVIGQNTFLGKDAGNFTLSGSANYQASDNTGIGAGTLKNLTSGYANTAVGSFAMPAVTSGRENSAVGLYGLYETNTGIQNSSLGAFAGRKNTTGSGNVNIGFEANFNNQTGSNNTIIGFRAGKGSSAHSKSGNVFIGANAGLNETGSNKLYIANSNTTSPLIGGDFALQEAYITGKLGIGTKTPAQTLHIHGAVEIPLTTNTSLGVIYKDGTSFMHDYKASTAIGQNTFLGKNAGNFTMSGEEDHQASDNTGVGTRALKNLTYGFANTAIGSDALLNVQTGSYNSAVGLYSLYATNTGVENSALGAFAGQTNTSGSGNVNIGYEANIFNQTGNNNTIIGYRAGRGNSAHNKTGNVFIGANAGYWETGNGKLYIDNTNTSTPLIGGDFASNKLYLHGDVGIRNSDPQAALHVSGSIIMQDGNQASGKVMVSDADGKASWSLNDFLPIGSIIAWAKNLSGVPALPNSFVECNGQTLSDPGSPLNGQVIPNLNGSGGGTARYLRGHTTSGTTGGSFDHTHFVHGETTGPSNTTWYPVGSGSTYPLTDIDHTHTISLTTNPTSTQPPFYTVIWIMRVK